MWLISYSVFTNHFKWTERPPRSRPMGNTLKQTILNKPSYDQGYGNQIWRTTREVQCHVYFHLLLHNVYSFLPTNRFHILWYSGSLEHSWWPCILPTVTSCKHKDALNISSKLGPVFEINYTGAFVAEGCSPIWSFISCFCQIKCSLYISLITYRYTQYFQDKYCNIELQLEVTVRIYMHTYKACKYLQLPNGHYSLQSHSNNLCEYRTVLQDLSLFCLNIKTTLSHCKGTLVFTVLMDPIYIFIVPLQCIWMGQSLS